MAYDLATVVRARTKLATPPMRTCAGCGCDLREAGRRRHAKTCSDRCRQRASRARRASAGTKRDTEESR